MLPVEYHPEARRDYDEAFDWYLEQSQPTSVAFAFAIRDTIAKIAEDPNRFARVGKLHRECGVDGFPFRIVFQVFDDHIRVIAISHASRRRFYWRRRT